MQTGRIYKLVILLSHCANLFVETNLHSPFNFAHGKATTDCIKLGQEGTMEQPFGLCEVDRRIAMAATQIPAAVAARIAEQVGIR
jgi:hypothetical protein